MNLKEYNLETTLDGKTLNVAIIITYEHDHYAHPEDDFDDERDIERALCGDIMPFDILVKALALGEEGIDSLGNCYVEDKDELLNIIEDASVVEAAVEDLKNSIRDKHALLNRFFGQELNCPSCGCTELLCGHPGQCCTKETF